MRGVSEHVVWIIPQDGPLSKKWFQRLWYFLEKHVTSNLNNNEASLSVLSIWPIIPTTRDKLVTIENGKTVLDATHRSTDSGARKAYSRNLGKTELSNFEHRDHSKTPTQTDARFHFIHIWSNYADV